MALLGVLVVATSLTGCSPRARGIIYSDTVQPLCKDLRGTTLGSKTGDGSSKRIQIPTTRLDITAEWDSRAIGDIAKEHGMQTVHACDGRVESLLLGLWRRDTVIVYGD